MKTRTLDIKAGPLFEQSMKSGAKIIVDEGGAGSGKTIKNLQMILTETMTDPDGLTTVTRETVPNLKRGPIRDWINVLAWAGATELFERNRTDHTWINKQTRHVVEFLAVDDEQKARGPRRKNLFMNEANEISLDTARQLMRRTSGKMWIDFNPSLLSWWVDTEILTRADAVHFLSTYKDNPFLPESEIREIEASVPVYEGGITDWGLNYDGEAALVSGDAYDWAVYGLGRRGSPAEAIYKRIFVSEFPDAESVVGVDFGFEHPMSVMRVARVDVEPAPRLHIQQLIHQSGLTVGEMIEMLPEAGVKRSDTLICDSARPDAIKEINDAGYRAQPSQKGAGSVLDGIDWMKGHELHFAPGSDGARTQFAKYRRKKIRGVITEDPLKLEDDAPDAVRYAAYDTWGRPQLRAGIW